MRRDEDAGTPEPPSAGETKVPGSCRHGCAHTQSSADRTTHRPVHKTRVRPAARVLSPPPCVTCVTLRRRSRQSSVRSAVPGLTRGQRLSGRRVPRSRCRRCPPCWPGLPTGVRPAGLHTPGKEHLNPVRAGEGGQASMWPRSEATGEPGGGGPNGPSRN